MTLGLVLDICVIFVLLASVIIAFMRGFVREVLTIFGILGGIVAAYIGGPLLSPLMRGWFGVVEGEESPEKLFDVIPYSIVADLLAYGAILVVFVILLSILSHFLAEFVKSVGLGPLDRTLGVVFGLARGIFVLGLLYMLPSFMIADEQKDEWFEGSVSRMYLDGVSGWMVGFLPDNMGDNVEQGEDAPSSVSEARKKMEDLNVLDPTEDITDLMSKDVLDGYGSDFREGMDSLIEKSVEDSAAE